MNHPSLKLDVKSGAPAVSIAKEFHIIVGKILGFFKVRGWGRLIIDDGDNWTVYIDPVATGTSELFKIPVLLGVKRANKDAAWEQMTLDEMITEKPTGTIYDVGAEETKALALRWDYVRAVEL
jgi:hypothetical protein